MKEQSKEEILSDLYAIRAAMSLVSQKTDVTRREEKGISSSKDKIQDAEFVIERDRQNSLSEAEKQFGVASKLKEIGAEKESLDKEMEECQKSYMEIEKNYRPEKYNVVFVLAFFGIGFLICAILGHLPAMGFHQLYEKLLRPKLLSQGWYYLLSYGTIFAILILATIIAAIVVRIRTNHENRRIKAEKKAALETESMKFNKMAARRNVLECNERALLDMQRRGALYFDLNGSNQLFAQHDIFAQQWQKLKEDESQAIVVSQLKITQIAKESQEIIENAKKLYPIIDFRDWANVDLIIFYYETGRADTMKEALQQVDRQRQNETLVKAVGMATEMIAKTIHQSVGSLEKTLDNSFRQLSVQLEFQHRRSLEEVSRLGSELEVQNEQLEKLGRQTEALRLSAEEQARVQASNQALTNALLEKINTSSTQLAYDMDKQLKLVHHISV